MEPGNGLMLESAFRGKKVLVTGHTGFKGAWLCQWLLDMGARVCGYSIDIPTNPSLFEALHLEEFIDHRIGDIRDLASLQQTFEEFQPEILFHMAAQPLVRASYEDPKFTFDTNVSGTVNVLECVRRSRSLKSSVFIATDKCYENMEWERGYQETDRLGGKDPYSASKACAEIVFSSYQRSFFSGASGLSRLASARAGNVIGGGDWASDRIVPDCVRAWGDHRSVTIRSPEAIRPWQHVLEPIRGYLMLAAQLLQPDTSTSGESFNFGPLEESSRSVADLLTVLSKHWPKSKWEVDRAMIGSKKEAGILRLNCEKAHSHLKWNACLSFEQTIALTASWYLDFLAGKDMRPITLKQIRDYQKLAEANG